MVRLGRLRRRDAAQVGVGRGADVGVAAGQVGVRVVPHHMLLAPHERRRAHLCMHALKVLEGPNVPRTIYESQSKDLQGTLCCETYEHLRLYDLAYSLASHPACMTHVGTNGKSYVIIHGRCTMSRVAPSTPRAPAPPAPWLASCMTDTPTSAIATPSSTAHASDACSHTAEPLRLRIRNVKCPAFLCLPHACSTQPASSLLWQMR